MDEKIKTETLHFPTKENPNTGEGIVQLANHIAVRMTSKWSINDNFLESSSGMKFFQLGICLTNQKPRCLYPCDKPINSRLSLIIRVNVVLNRTVVVGYEEKN